MTKTQSIKSFILGAALLVSVLLFGALYLVISQVYDRTVHADAGNISGILARQTFDAMFQVMRRGWSRHELEEFVGAMRTSFSDTPYSLEIYRGPTVAARFGPIAQPPLDAALHNALGDGEERRLEEPQGFRYLYPLHARDECLRCHTNARVGEVLGVIEIRQELAPVVAKARANFLATLAVIAPLPLLVAFLVATFITRRLDAAIGRLRDDIGQVNKVADLTTLRVAHAPVHFRELQEVLVEVDNLAEKLRGFAVDKELLEFEIRLLERFIITSEVVRDWQEYVKRLLLDINNVIAAYTLFSIFKINEEMFDLEVFWRDPPDEATRRGFEAAVRETLDHQPALAGLPIGQCNHHIADPAAAPLSLSSSAIALHTKSLLVDIPKIGGIVGIGLQAAERRDEVRLLVAESILSTMLNVVGSVKAISKYTKDLEYYATRDPLTGLFNQRVFWELLEYEIARAERHAHRFALLMIDLDNFKAINDRHGHAVGDDYLRAFGRALQQVVRRGDVVARYGGDEFVMILTEVDDELPIAVAERLLEVAEEVAIAAPDGGTIHGTASIGLALHPDHAGNARDLFLFADNMMYKAKGEGKNRFAAPGDQDLLETFRAIADKCQMVSRALDEARIVPYFQPIVAAADGTLHACEVLTRIRLDDGRIVAAGEFVEAAERMGLIHNLDYATMEKAFQQAARQGYRGILFVNISPRALVLSEFFPTVKQLVVDAGIRPAQVVFEITERETIHNVQALEQFVERLRLEGFKFAIDDFGSGFSSFHYIKRFPIDYIKIEGEFIANSLSDRRDRAFVRSIALLARELGIRTVGEFVESEESLRELAANGVDLAQGYHISRPQPEIPAG